MFPVKTAIRESVRMVLLAFSLAGIANAQDIALGQDARPVASAARVIPDAEPAELSGMLAAHNQLRARLGLEPLAWSADLADAARANARNASEGACTMGSTGRALRDEDVSVYWGASLRRLGGVDTAQDISPNYVVSYWREGRSGYDAGKEVCQDTSPKCASYKRIVTPANREVGCARLICPNQAQIWVCKYRP